ncbi:MAG: carbohydrate kinase [Phycisphaerae bacterium]|nr:carbohydrate kinase [Phycisphaerae bacterium]
MKTKSFENKKILCIGEALWDVLPSGEAPGGAPMNVAIHLNQFGVNASFVSCVGDDEYGHRLLAFLAEKGLDTTCIQHSHQWPTGMVTVSLDSQKNASYTICDPAAWDHIAYDEALASMAAKAEILVLGSLAARCETSRNTIIRLLDTMPMSLLDINLRAPCNTREQVEPLLGKAAMLKLNDEELEVVTRWHHQSFCSIREAIVWIGQYYDLNLIVTTLGQAGALLWVDNTFYHHPGVKADVADTVGAGDAFLAAFLASLVQGTSWEKALDMACQTGAFLVTQKGATPQLPDTLKHAMSRQG